jgi:hypothetical protein
MQTFSESNSEQSGYFPLTMRLARIISVSDLPPIPYEPSSQMSIYGGDTMKMMGSKDRSTCSRSSSTGERIRDFGKSDDDRKTDD